MLHRSFKPAKCKTALRLASSRIKLLKNKKEAQIKQLKRELAQLLESGQERTARIRVEHVVREEKTMAAYDLIEIYCELIVARLAIIESQKNCPIDMKEAITSVVFAAPRCGADIPELLDVRKHFTAKYGKEFISSAVELRPDCGVSRMLVEKLSAKAPDGQTKMKILSAIAEEHNIKWDPNSLDKDEKPPEDLLNGPNTFEKASKMNLEPPNVQAPPNRDQMHDVPINTFENNVRSAPSSQNFASADIGAHKMTTPGTSHTEARPSETGTERRGSRPSYSGDENSFPLGRQNWNMEFKDATSAAQAAAESAELASMAARAAAELSSRGKITRQYSTESQNSSVHRLRDEAPGRYGGSEPHGDYLAKDPVNNSFHDRNPRKQYEQTDGHGQNNLAGVADRLYRNSHTKKSSGSDSLKFNAASPDDDAMVNSLEKAGGFSQKSSSEVESIKPENSDLFGEGSMKKHSSESEEEFLSEMQYGTKTDNVDYFGEQKFRNQSSGVSSRSRSGTFGEDGAKKQSEFEEEFLCEMTNSRKTENIDYFAEERSREQSGDVSSHPHSRTFHDDYDDVLNSSHQEFGNDASEDPLVGMGQENIHTDAKQTPSYDNAAVFFDESGSDDDDGRFDVEGKHNGQESNLFFTSPGKKSPTHLSANTNTWSSSQTMSGSLGKSIQHSLFKAEGGSASELPESFTKSTVRSQPDDLPPATFDDSDGPSSESEEELDKSKLDGTTNHDIFSRKDNVHSRNPEPTPSESHWLAGSSYAEERDSESNRKPWLHPTSDESDLGEAHPDKNQGTEFNSESQKKSGYGVSSTHKPSPKLTKAGVDSNDMYRKSLNSAFDEGKPHQSMRSSRSPVLYEAEDNVQVTESLGTMGETEFLNQSSLESGKELNLGMLTGGLRNKGFRLPPYSRSQLSDASSSSKQAAENSSTTTEHSTASPTVKTSVSSGAYNQKASTEADKRPRLREQVTQLDSDDDSSEEELPRQTFRSNQEPYNQIAGVEGNNKSSRRPSTYFDLDHGDCEEDLPKQNSTSKSHLGSAFSRRTKASPSHSGKNSHSKVTGPSGVSATSDQERNSSRSSYATQTLPMARSQKSGSGDQENPEQLRSAEKASSKPMPESKFSLRNERAKPSAFEQPSIPPPKSVASGSTESSNTSISSRDTPSREKTLKKATHVHPKLPDYDTLTAHLQSLRSDRK